MNIVISLIIGAVVGFILGFLFFRNNAARLQKAEQTVKDTIKGDDK